jgi:hypothetical protein
MSRLDRMWDQGDMHAAWSPSLTKVQAVKEIPKWDLRRTTKNSWTHFVCAWPDGRKSMPLPHLSTPHVRYRDHIWPVRLSCQGSGTWYFLRTHGYTELAGRSPPSPGTLDPTR